MQDSHKINKDNKIFEIMEKINYFGTKVRNQNYMPEKAKNRDVGFEVFTAVVMKSIIFWDMTPCSLLSYNRRFGG
jgi:hypothetical protein